MRSISCCRYHVTCWLFGQSLAGDGGRRLLQRIGGRGGRRGRTRVVAGHVGQRVWAAVVILRVLTLSKRRVGWVILHTQTRLGKHVYCVIL